MQHNLIEKSGAWYSYKGERIGQGRENAKQFLRENSDVFKKVDAELRKQLGLVRAEQRCSRRASSGGCSTSGRGRNARAGLAAQGVVRTSKIALHALRARTDC